MMDPVAASPDLLTSIGSGLSSALIQMVAAMLTPEIAFLALVSLMLTQAVKIGLTYVYRSPPAEMIWFVIGPVATLLPALFIWNQPGLHWFYAACAASLMANLFYALFLKRIVGRLAPKTYSKINVPHDRRKRNRKPPGGVDRRSWKP